MREFAIKRGCLAGVLLGTLVISGCGQKLDNDVTKAESSQNESAVNAVMESNSSDGVENTEEVSTISSEKETSGVFLQAEELETQAVKPRGIAGKSYRRIYNYYDEVYFSVFERLLKTEVVFWINPEDFEKNDKVKKATLQEQISYLAESVYKTGEETKLINPVYYLNDFNHDGMDELLITTDNCGGLQLVIFSQNGQLYGTYFSKQIMKCVTDQGYYEMTEEGSTIYGRFTVVNDTMRQTQIAIKSEEGYYVQGEAVSADDFEAWGKKNLGNPCKPFVKNHLYREESEPNFELINSEEAFLKNVEDMLLSSKDFIACSLVGQIDVSKYVLSDDEKIRWFAYSVLSNSDEIAYTLKEDQFVFGPDVYLQALVDLFGKNLEDMQMTQNYVNNLPLSMDKENNLYIPIYEYGTICPAVTVDKITVNETGEVFAEVDYEWFSYDEDCSHSTLESSNATYPCIKIRYTLKEDAVSKYGYIITGMEVLKD